MYKYTYMYVYRIAGNIGEGYIIWWIVREWIKIVIGMFNIGSFTNSCSLNWHMYLEKLGGT